VTSTNSLQGAGNLYLGNFRISIGVIAIFCVDVGLGDPYPVGPDSRPAAWKAMSNKSWVYARERDVGRVNGLGMDMGGYIFRALLVQFGDSAITISIRPARYQLDWSSPADFGG